MPGRRYENNTAANYVSYIYFETINTTIGTIIMRERTWFFTIRYFGAVYTCPFLNGKYTRVKFKKKFFLISIMFFIVE